MTTDVVESPVPARPAPGPRQGEVLEAIPITQAVERFRAIGRFAREVMRPGVDYGRVPGTDKDTLLKPGAEKLCVLFNLHQEAPQITREEDWTGAYHGGEPFFYYEVEQTLTRQGAVVASAVGSCNSWEKKYRWRQQERKCPRCSAEAIRFSKDRPEWYCWRKVGGCGATFPKDDQAIASQKPGRVANPDIFDQVNTILKMAAKRALVAAVLVATGASEFYTADLEDFAEGEVPPGQPGAPAPGREPGADDVGALPAPGQPFLDWLEAMEDAAVTDGLCQQGDLRALLVKEAREKYARAKPDPGQWKPAGVAWAVGRVEEVLRQYRALRGEDGNGGRT